MTCIDYNSILLVQYTSAKTGVRVDKYHCDVSYLPNCIRNSVVSSVVEYSGIGSAIGRAVLFTTRRYLLLSIYW